MDGSEAGQSEDPHPRLGPGLGRLIVIFILIWAGSAMASRVWAATSADPASVARVPALTFIMGALLLGSAAVSASETALFSLNRLDIFQLRKINTSGARAVTHLLDHPHDTLTTVLVLNNLINIAISLTIGALTEALLPGSTALGFAVAAFGATTMVVVFGETLPKCVALSRPHPMARFLAPPIFLASKLLLPLRFMTNVLLGPIYDRLSISAPDPDQEVSEEELKAVISAGEVSMALEEQERDMIHGVFELRHTFADEIMTPRTEVVAFPDTLDQDELLVKLRETNHSRALIYHENLDEIVGFLLAKEVLLNPEKPWREFIREAPILPMRIKLLELLKAFRKHMTKLAVLVDEFGGCAGIVTLHDLMEEIVGDMAERNEPARSDVITVQPGRWVVQGRTHLDDLSDELDTRFPEDLGSTIGGFVMNTLGRVPAAGDEVRHDGYVIRVTRVVGRRVMELEITRHEEAAVENGEPREAAS